MFIDFYDKLNKIGDASLLQELVTLGTIRHKIRLYVKRDDLIHPLIMGNKWRKLKYNLLFAYQEGFETLLTFGGAYSNHILAVAAAGNELGFKTIGVIRGEELSENSNITLQLASKLGMRLHFVSRENYQQRDSEVWVQNLRDYFGKFYLIPEGGNNELALKGVSEMVSSIKMPFDYYCCASGTGNTAMGFACTIPEASKLLVFPTLKQFESQRMAIQKYAEGKQVEIIYDYLFGGYAKGNEQIGLFMENFCIPTDQVYTSKLFYGVLDLIGKRYFPEGSKVLIYHSGGYR